MEEYHDASDGSTDGVIEDVKEALVEYPDVFEDNTLSPLPPSQQRQTRVWAAGPITTIRVSAADGGFIQVSPVETNPILKELISKELDDSGVYNLISQKLIPSFDYNPLTHKRNFRFRRFVGSPNPENMEIRLVDGTPTTLIVQYDF
jgi:hypothetical protein